MEAEQLHTLIGVGLASAAVFFTLGMIVGAWWEKDRQRQLREVRDRSRRYHMMDQALSPPADYAADDDTETPMFHKRQAD